MNIPFEAVQKLAEEFGLTRAILFAHDPSGKDHIVTWGASTIDSSNAAEFGNSLKRVMGWPDSLQCTSPKIEKLCNWVLRSHLEAAITEGMAAELLNVNRIELRQMMIDRYGDDWRDAAENGALLKLKLIAAGDLDETIKYMNENGIGVNPDGTTYKIGDE